MSATWWTPERVAVLEAEARSWIGTPFAANSSAKGIGVSCQKLAGCLYQASGYPDVLDVPDVPMAHARFSRTSFVVAWFTAREDFALVDPSGPILPGDVLGFTLGHIVHHIGIALPGGMFAHAIDGAGASLASLADATWGCRLKHVWRPRA